MVAIKARSTKLGALGDDGIGLMEGPLARRFNIGPAAAYADDAALAAMRWRTAPAQVAIPPLADGSDVDNAAKFRKSKKHQQPDPMAELEPSTLAKAEGWANLGLSIVGGVTGFVPFLLGGLSIPAGWINQRFGAWLYSPVERMQKPTLTDLGNNIPGGNAVGRAVVGAVEAVAGPAETIAKVSGLQRFNTWRHDTLGARQLKKVRAAALACANLLQPYQSELATHGLHTPLNAMHTMVTQAAHAGDIDIAALKQHAENVADIIKNNDPAKQVLLGNKPLSKSYQKLVSAFEEHGALSNAIQHHADAAAWRNPADAIKNTAKNLRNVSAMHGIANAAFLGMEGMAVAGLARTFSENLASLGQMYEDMTGKKAGTFRLLTGNVPAPVAEARSHLFKQFSIKGATQATSLLMQLKSTIRGSMSGKAMLASFALPQLASGAEGFIGSSPLPMYKTFSTMLKAGYDISAAPVVANGQEQISYAGFITSADKRFAALGSHHPITIKVAEQIKAEGLTAGQIMQEVATGKLAKRGDALVAAMAPAAVETVSHGSTKHVDALTRKDKPQVAVHGPHTQRYANQAAPGFGREQA